MFFCCCSCFISLKKNLLFFFLIKKIFSFLLVYGDIGFNNVMWIISCCIFVIDEEDYIDLIVFRKY